MKKISKELMGASAIPFILLFLTENDTYGYEIIQKVKELSGGVIVWKEGSLYPVLKKMEEREYIRSYWNTMDHGRPRKYYTIQKVGHDALIVFAKEWGLVNRMFDELMFYPKKGGIMKKD